jgi:hypothetical protein
MRITQVVVFETLRRMQVFVDDYEETLGEVSHSGARKRLDETAERMAAHMVAQVAGRRISQGETARLHALRQTLRNDQMLPVALIAGQHLSEQPEFKLLRVPSWRVRGAGIIPIARDMANAAEKYMELFVEEGLSPNFVAELRTATDRFEESILARGQAKIQEAGATEGLKVETKRARGRIAVLDSLIRPKLALNAQLLREWEFAKHIQRTRKPRNAPAPSTPDTLTATTLPIGTPDRPIALIDQAERLILPPSSRSEPGIPDPNHAQPGSRIGLIGSGVS